MMHYLVYFPLRVIGYYLDVLLLYEGIVTFYRQFVVICDTVALDWLALKLRHSASIPNETPISIWTRNIGYCISVCSARL